MKKTTFLKQFAILLILSITTSLSAQYAGPGEYLIIHKESGKFLTVDVAGSNITGADEIAPLDASQTFEIKELTGADGTSTYYNFSCTVPEFDAVRTHSLNVLPTGTSTPTTGTNNTRVHNITLESGQTNSYDINTPQTTTPRIWTYDAENNNVKYVDVPSEVTKWELVPLFALSVDDFNTSSIIISNPINNSIEIKGLSNKVNKIEVFNLNGQSVLKSDTRGVGSVSIEANSLKSGIYLVRIYGEKTTLTKKVIKI